MIRRRIGFLSSIDDNRIGAMHYARAIFTRSEKPPQKYGRAHVYALADDAGGIFLSECGVLLVYGKDDKKIAQAMLSRKVLRVVTVTAAKPKKDSQVAIIAEKLTSRGIIVDHVVIKKTGGCQARDYSPGGAHEILDSVYESLRKSSAPSSPKKHIEPEQHTAPSAPRKPVAKVDTTPPSTPAKKKTAKKPVQTVDD